MFSSDNEYLSIFFGEGEIKAAHLKVTPSSLELLHLSRKDIKGVKDEEMPGIIQALLSSINYKRMSSVLVVPASAVTTKNIEIPSRDPTEIKSIINLQAGRHTPYSRDEILIGFINIGVYQVNYTKVLLVIVNRQVIRKILKSMEQAGLMVERVLFAPEGVAAFYSRVLNLKKDDSTVGIIDIEEHFTNFVILLRGIVIACRSIPLGISHLQQDPAAETKLLAEIKRSADAYQNEDIEKLPESYSLTNRSAHTQKLQPLLSDELKCKVTIEPYLEQLKIAPGALKVIEENDNESFLDTIAGAVSVADAQIDLMPDEIKMQRSLRAQGQEIIKLCGLTVVLIALICAVFFNKIYFKNAFLNKIITSYSKQHKQVEKLEEIAARTRIVKDYLNSRMVALDITKELYKLVPDEMYLEQLQLDEKGVLGIKGVSESMSRVFALVTALEDSELFKSVKTQSTTAKKERGKDVAAFEITFKLESAKDDEPPSSDKKEEKETK